MPAAIDEVTKTKLIGQWISGFTRTKIATENDIGKGTITGIISDFKRGLESSDFKSVRQLAVESKKQGLRPSSYYISRATKSWNNTRANNIIE